MNRKLLFIPLFLFLALAAAFLVQLTRNANGDDPTLLESALIGKPVPTFRLESLENPGQYYQADALIQGKPLLLNVWATWCPTCRAEHDYLNTLRLRKACECLLHSHESVRDIATRVGFSDVTYFISAFKKGIGETPLQYRKNHPGA